MVQRGNRRQQTFFCAADYARYVDLLHNACRLAETEVWSWCLMPNHVHLLLVPSSAKALSHVMGSVHQTYAWAINRQRGWTGCLWQGRYFSVSLDDEDTAAVARYIELNPVRAKLVTAPEQWRWSSAAARMSNAADQLMARPFLST